MASLVRVMATQSPVELHPLSSFVAASLPFSTHLYYPALARPPHRASCCSRCSPFLCKTGRNRRVPSRRVVVVVGWEDRDVPPTTAIPFLTHPPTQNRKITMHV